MRNPKTKAGLAALAVLLILGGVLASRMVPTIQETRREMSLTPTPLPEMPDSVQQVTRDPSAPTPEPILRSGSKGPQVTNLQSRLQTLGYYPGEIDGEFGAMTRDAVMAFQRQNGLEADGLVGSETKDLLFSANAKPYSAPAGEEQEAGGPDSGGTENEESGNE